MASFPVPSTSPSDMGEVPWTTRAVALSVDRASSSRSRLRAQRMFPSASNDARSPPVSTMNTSKLVFPTTSSTRTFCSTGCRICTGHPLLALCHWVSRTYTSPMEVPIMMWYLSDASRLTTTGVASAHAPIPLCASEFMPAVPPSTMSPRGADQSVDKSSTSWTDQYFHLKLYPKIALATYLPLKSSVSSPPSTLACFPKLLPSTPPGPPPLHSSSSK
mmetsp:Transcript_27971/g.67400  ORF Transcript_27971/g.67400 Transcript_27971/m.67400 type:complete len:218 (-) Transcript_27971:730-1383(-)